MDEPRTPPHDTPPAEAGGDEAQPTEASAPTPHPESAAADAGANEQLDPFLIVQAELERLAAERDAAREEARAERDRALRTRAELENLRRRQQAELDRARAQGQDAAIASVFAVHDDLDRALAAAARSGDPAAIVPGVEGVLASLLRALESLGFQRTGAVGERFDAALHEAIMVVPTPEGAEPGTIQAVFEVGFKQGDRLVRPARVIVHQE